MQSERLPAKQAQSHHGPLSALGLRAARLFPGEFVTLTGSRTAFLFDKSRQHFRSLWATLFRISCLEGGGVFNPIFHVLRPFRPSSLGFNCTEGLLANWTRFKTAGTHSVHRCLQ
ncbi:hypothetical protein OF83DRAFT_599417 [Amylostereum chailletii]|nr:hypothetical protein OF83DRAFT_599417 [Amylostereum chailletii]